jgi:Putative Flp pilus-assembly TadE/G-like
MRFRRAVRTPAQALLWLVMLVPLLLSIAGLAIDGGALLDSRRELQSFADGAARAGATRLDVSRLRASDGLDVELDPNLANQAAREYLAESQAVGQHTWDAPPQAEIEVDGRRVDVLLRAKVHTAFLRIVFIDNVPVGASASAELQFGIHNGSGG